MAIFIDTQNLYHSAKHLHNARVNFPALVDAVTAGRTLIRAIAYVAKSKTGEESAFFEALTQNGIELKIKDVQEFSSGAKKADWDVGMAVDAITISQHVDVVILLTGDGDFTPVVDYLHAHGVRCEIGAFARSTNQGLKEIADAFFDISENPDPFLIRAGNRFAYSPPTLSANPMPGTAADELAEKKDGRPKKGKRNAGDAPSGRKIRITY